MLQKRVDDHCCILASTLVSGAVAIQVALLGCILYALNSLGQFNHWTSLLANHSVILD